MRSDPTSWRRVEVPGHAADVSAACFDGDVCMRKLLARLLIGTAIIGAGAAAAQAPRARILYLAGRAFVAQGNVVVEHHHAVTTSEVEADPRYTPISPMRWRSRKPRTAIRPAASSAATSAISGRTPTMFAASGGGPARPASRQRTRRGRRCSTSTRWLRRRRQTGSGRAQRAPAPPNDAVCSMFLTAARMRSLFASSTSSPASPSTGVSACPRASSASRGRTRMVC